jgi:hypothetical protein
MTRNSSDFFFFFFEAPASETVTFGFGEGRKGGVKGQTERRCDEVGSRGRCLGMGVAHEATENGPVGVGGGASNVKFSESGLITGTLLGYAQADEKRKWKACDGIQSIRE